MLELLTVGDAAKTLLVSPDSVRLYAEQGKLRTLRTRNGVRLFRAVDVERLAKERNHKRKELATHP